MSTRKFNFLFYIIVPVLAPIIFFLLIDGVLRIFNLGAPNIANNPARGFLPFHSLFMEKKRKR